VTDAQERIAQLLRQRNDLWDMNRHGINYVLHGSDAVRKQDAIDSQLKAVRHELLSLGYSDRFCRPDNEPDSQSK
jgi:hypothetical protein